MRFVAVKSEACSSILVLHRTRDLLVRQRTQIGNAIRAHMTLETAKRANALLGLRRFVGQSVNVVSVPAKDVAFSPLSSIRQMFYPAIKVVKVARQRSIASVN
jgi:transposase